MRRYWRPETGIFLATWLLLLSVGRSSLLQDPGSFWHSVVGERMLAGDGLPHVDAFSFTFAGRPWIASQWLAECGMALLYRWGGFDALVLAAATLLAALSAWLAKRLLQAGLALPAVAALLALVFAAASHHFHVRPHLATIAGIGLTYGLLCDVESGRTSLWRLLWLPPLFAVWTNLHGGVLAGLATVVLVAAGWLAARAIGRDSPIRTCWQAAGLAVVVTACAAAFYVNPYGAQLPRTWLYVMGQDLPDLIEEHAPLNWSHPEAWMVAVLAAAYLVALLSTLPRFPRATWLMPLAWTWLAIDRVRHAPLMAVVAALALAEILPYSRFCAWLRRREWMRTPNADSLNTDRPGWRTAVLPAACVALALLCQTASWPVPVIGAGWSRLDPRVWPVELVPELQRVSRETPAPAPIFNSLDLGGFVMLYAPGLRTFIDDRCELFGGRFLRDYAEAERAHPERIDGWAADYGFDHALVRSGSSFDAYLQQSANWSPVAHAHAATLYRRTRLVAEP